jgi:hypothetical protein
VKVSRAPVSKPTRASDEDGKTKHAGSPSSSPRAPSTIAGGEELQATSPNAIAIFVGTDA